MAAAVLALGIGASTAIFSAVNPILFQPLPYPEARRIMMVWESRREGSPLDAAFGTFQGLSERTRSFESLAVMKPWQPAMIGNREPERIDGQQVSSAYFRMLGIAPALGRDFTAADDQYHGPKVVILSDGLWRRRFAADPAIIGRQITLDDNPYTVIGVMPHGLRECAGADGANLGAAAIRSGAAGRRTRVGTSSADDRPPAARCQPRAGAERKHDASFSSSDRFTRKATTIPADRRAARWCTACRMI